MTDRYVPVQARRDLDYGTFVISSNDAMFLGDAVIAQDAGITIPETPGDHSPPAKPGVVNDEKSMNAAVDEAKKMC